MKVLLAHPGTQHSHHLAYALHQRNALLAYCTTLAFGERSKLASWLPDKLVARRKLSVPASFIHLQPMLEMFERVAPAGAGARNMFIARNRLFQQLIPQRLIRSADAIIGFDTSSAVLAE